MTRFEAIKRALDLAHRDLGEDMKALGRSYLPNIPCFLDLHADSQ